jgi:hypothetical protein
MPDVFGFMDEFELLTRRRLRSFQPDLPRFAGLDQGCDELGFAHGLHLAVDGVRRAIEDGQRRLGHT